MFINSPVFTKFMRVEDAFSNKSYIDCSVVRPEMYKENQFEYMKMEFSFPNQNFIEKLKTIRFEKIFSRIRTDPDDPSVRLALTRQQIEDVRDALFDAITEFDFQDFEERFDIEMDRYDHKNLKTFYTPKYSLEKEFQLFKSTTGLQLLIREHPDFYSSPFILGYSLEDYNIIHPKKKSSEILSYLFQKNKKFPFDSAYFDLSWDETIQFIAAISFALNEKNIDIFFIDEDEEEEE